MKKVLYTVLSILSIVYIAFLAVNIFKELPGSNIDMGGFETWFDLIVNFGGVAIIFCFAMVNFSGSPLKTVFFIILIVVVVAYVILLAAPEFFLNLFNPSAGATALL